MIEWKVADYGGASRLRRATPATPAREEAASARTPPTTPRDAAPVADKKDVAPTVTKAALPAVEELNRAEETIVRMKIQYPGTRPAYPFADEGQGAEPGVEKAETPAEIMNETKCQTCARRKYQDGSDDPGVSFKTPTKMNPDQAATAVRGHEQEHVVRERARAEREDRKVVSQSVTLHTEICPECGRIYVSGGVTRTVTADDKREDENGLSAQFAGKENGVLL